MGKNILIFGVLVAFLMLLFSPFAFAFDNIVEGFWKIDIKEKNVYCGQERSGLEDYLWGIKFQQNGYTVSGKLVGGDTVNEAAAGYSFSGIVKDDKLYLFGTGGPDCAYNSFIEGVIIGDRIIGDFKGGDCFCKDFGTFEAQKIENI